MSSFVLTSVLAAKNKQERQERVDFWCEVLKQMTGKNNFTYMSCLHSSLDFLHKSKLAEQYLLSFSPSQVRDLEEAGKFQFGSLSKESNYRKCLERLFAQGKAGVPFMGDLNKQLIHLEEKRDKFHPNEPHKQGHVNWKFLESVTDALFFFRHFRNLAKQRPPPRRSLEFDSARKWLMGAKGMGDNISLKNQIVGNIVSQYLTPENYSAPDWDEICDCRTVQGISAGVEISALLVQLNDISASLFPETPGKDEPSGERKYEMLSNWKTELIKNEQKISLTETLSLSFACVFLLSDALEQILKHYLRRPFENDDIRQAVVFLFRKSLFCVPSSFQIDEFLSSFFRLKLGDEVSQKLARKLAKVISSLRSLPEVVECTKEFKLEVDSVSLYKLEDSGKTERDLSPFFSLFSSFMSLSRAFGKLGPVLEGVHASLESVTQPSLLSGVEKKINSLHLSKLSRQECTLENFPRQLLVNVKMDEELSLEDHTRILESEMANLLQRVDVLRQKKDLIRAKIKTNQSLILFKESFSSFREVFDANVTELSKNFSQIPSRNQMLDKFESAFDNVSSICESLLKGSSSGPMSALLPRLPKIAADLRNIFLPLFSHDKFRLQSLENKLERIFSMGSPFLKKVVAVEMPMPSGKPKIKLSKKAYSTFKTKLGAQMVEKMSEENTISLRSESEEKDSTLMVSPKVKKEGSLTVDDEADSISDFVCLWDYDGGNTGDGLSLRTGDIFTVLDKSNQLWWFGINKKNGNTGYVPSSFLELSNYEK